MIDSIGNEIHVGAILKVYHFTDHNRRKHWMYKQVVNVTEDGRIRLAHLPIKDLKDGYNWNGHQYHDALVVQCDCNEHLWTNLRKNKKFNG